MIADAGVIIAAEAADIAVNSAPARRKAVAFGAG
jgi:hypothetical protein